MGNRGDRTGCIEIEMGATPSHRDLLEIGQSGLIVAELLLGWLSVPGCPAWWESGLVESGLVGVQAAADAEWRESGRRPGAGWPATAAFLIVVAHIRRGRDPAAT
jgi:hypothetical protein